ncbi:MAG: adenosylcobinamide-GDP ribazoletransferase [Candidatus Aquicultor sp.]
MKAFRFALSFLTILPGGIRGEVEERVFGDSIKYFAVVGAILGLLLAGVHLLIATRVAQPAASIIVVASLVALTRAFHVDALADTFDGLFGGRDKEHMLAIMKDSRVGSFGVAAIVVAFALKFSLLAATPAALTVGTLIAFPVLGRWAAAIATSTQPSARPGVGLGSLFAERARPWELILSSAIAFAIVGVALWTRPVAALAAVGIAGAFLVIYVYLVKRKIGGMTGDTLGALIELTEIAVLFAMALL